MFHSNQINKKVMPCIFARSHQLHRCFLHDLFKKENPDMNWKVKVGLVRNHFILLFQSSSENLFVK